jgi:hypothetical protein
MADQKPIKFYVVICFREFVGGPVVFVDSTHMKRKEAAVAAGCAKAIWGWAKVVRCKVEGK